MTITLEVRSLVENQRPFGPGAEFGLAVRGELFFCAEEFRIFELHPGEPGSGKRLSLRVVDADATTCLRAFLLPDSSGERSYLGPALVEATVRDEAGERLLCRVRSITLAGPAERASGMISAMPFEWWARLK